MAAEGSRVRGRRRPVLRAVVVVVVAVLVASVSGFLVFANVTYAAERAPVETLAADPAVDVRWSYDSVVLTPSGGPSDTGLVFIPGAKVDPLAYAPKLSGVVADAGVTVVIPRPVLNFAIVDPRPLTDFEALAPAVSRWFVGGHSLGGVKACQFAEDDAVEGLVLFGSYCAGDASALSVPVLSISASNDGLSTPADIESSRSSLPASATFVQLEGATHAQFGDYGLQPGDGTSTTSDSAVAAALTATLLPFLTAP